MSHHVKHVNNVKKYNIVNIASKDHVKHVNNIKKHNIVNITSKKTFNINLLYLYNNSYFLK